MTDAYLWRYREEIGDEMMDMLFLMEPSEKFMEGEPGEVTVVRWN